MRFLSQCWYSLLMRFQNYSNCTVCVQSQPMATLVEIQNTLRGLNIKELREQCRARGLNPAGQRKVTSDPRNLNMPPVVWGFAQPKAGCGICLQDKQLTNIFCCVQAVSSSSKGVLRTICVAHRIQA